MLSLGSKIHVNGPRVAPNWILLILLITLTVQDQSRSVSLSFSEASEIQSPNQAPSTQNHQQSSTEFPAQQSVAQAAVVGIGTSSQLRLPKINIYINKNEIKKLLGIDTRINYVTNGNINTYPLGFTIPLGYNQSDIIFTWQNLGQTNVNYSISLVIGNIQAVDPPLINITRSGLIPKYEQVFKITLPCSGKVTDEVDVQVLINIVGFAADDEPSNGAGQFEVINAQPMSSNAAPSQQEANASSSTAEFMQSDQASDVGPKLRLVSHTLAIKRKKICTMHPVQVAVQPRAPQLPPQVQPAQHHQQQQQLPGQSELQPPTINRWTQASQTDYSTQIQTQISKETKQNVGVLGIHSNEHSTHANLAGFSSPSTQSSLADNDPLEASTRKLEQLNLIPAQPRIPFSNQQQAQTANARRQGALSEAPLQLGFYPNWPHPASRIPSAISPENPLNDIISNRQTIQQQQSVGGSSNNNNPLVLTLIGLSLLISVALIIVAILGSTHQTPLNKLNSLKCCILRRAPASQANKCKSPMVNAVIGSLRVEPKSSTSSVSGLSDISGQSHSKSPAYCYKTNCTSYYTNSSQYHQQQQQQQHHQHHQQLPNHHYQHPPTADLLGTGYQCQQAPPPPQYPIYHIATGNTNQTTRLIWNNGNGTSPDGFTIDGSYMPLSNAARSDSGSVYQTIY